MSIHVGPGDDPIDRAVMQFMAEQGIDRRRVIGYRVSKDVLRGNRSEPVVLELSMMMNDMTEPASEITDPKE